MKNYLKVFVAALVAAVLVVGVCYAYDLHNRLKIGKAINPVSVSNNDNTDGAIIDRLGYRAVEFAIQTGTLADTDVTLTPHLFSCALDNCDDNVAVAATDLVGTVAGATFAATDDNTVKKIGYGGTARYLRLRITPANNTGAAAFSAIYLLGDPQYLPVP